MSITSRFYWRRLGLVAILALAGTVSHAQAPRNPSDGQAWIQDNNTRLWDARSETWAAPETFWLSFVEASEGKFWGRSTEYPAYDEVNEHDLFLVEVEQGTCLMYFFHSRWRRAQDVRRWDPVINDIEGCPYVFD